MDDIWDEPAAVSASAPRAPEPLFTFSDDEDVPQSAPKRILKKAQPKEKRNGDIEDIVADLFDDIIDPDDIQPPSDINALLAKRANAAKSASNDANKNKEASGTAKDASPMPEEEPNAETKPKRTIAKVDEQRLLSERGIPALVKEAKKFKPKGKGHEVEDLDRLMSIYQFWAHNMFPKTQFLDTIDRVERVCRSRRMLINMSMWRDAENNSGRPERDPNKSDSSEDENDVEAAPIDAAATTVVSIAEPSALPTSTRVATTSQNISVDEEADLWGDVDDALADLQTSNIRQAVAPVAVNKPPQDAFDDDELEEWFNADNDPPAISSKPPESPPADAMDIDIPHDEPVPNNPKRLMSPPTADNWDEDLFS